MQLPLLGVAACGRSESSKESERERILTNLVFRMPLNRKSEALGIPNLDRFNCPIGRHRFHVKALGDPVKCLPMKRVNFGLRYAAGNLLEEAAGSDLDQVALAILNVKIVALRPTVIEPTGQFMNSWMKRSTQGDVQLLHSATDGEKGKTSL